MSVAAETLLAAVLALPIEEQQIFVAHFSPGAFRRRAEEERMRARDAAIAELAEALGGGKPLKLLADEVAAEIRMYISRGWLRERSRAQPPNGILARLLWSVARSADGKPPASRQHICRILLKFPDKFGHGTPHRMPKKAA
jgi:hypothetical protein